MFHDHTHAATLQARYESPAVEVGIFTPTPYARSLAACAGALVALDVGLDCTGLDEQVANAIHEHNTTHPAEHDEDARRAEWAEAYRVAHNLIAEYAEMPVAAGTWLLGMKAGQVMERVS